MAREIMSEERESYTSNWKRVLSGIRREYIGGKMGSGTFAASEGILHEWYHIIREWAAKASGRWISFLEIAVLSDSQ